MKTEWINLRSIFDNKTKNYFPDIGSKTLGKILQVITGEELIIALSQHNKTTLTAISGISEIQVLTLLQGYAKYNILMDMAVFLDVSGFNYSIAINIYEVWGSHSLKNIHKNPYHLLAFASWNEVDPIGLKRGPEFHPCRVMAAIQNCLYTDFEDNKHTFTCIDMLYVYVKKLIGCDRTTFDDVLRSALTIGAVKEHHGYIQIPAVYIFERKLESFLGQNQATGIMPKKITQVLESELDFKLLTDEQWTAVINAMSYRLSAVHGRGGRGKTFTLRAITKAAKLILGKNVILSAVTAKACRRMEAEVGHPAFTVAALLHGKNNRFDFNNSVVVIDEASMLSLVDAYQLFKHLPESSHLLLLGDQNQIPSVEAGRIFFDIINNNAIPNVELTINKRQDDKTDRQLNLILNGVFPEFEKYSADSTTGIYRHAAKNNDEIEQLTTELYMHFRRNGCEVQIISPLRQYSCGTQSINNKVHYSIHNTSYYCNGTPVVWTKNIKAKCGVSLTNGSTGIVTGLDLTGTQLNVDFEHEGTVTLMPDEIMKFLEMSYCLTVHRSQGSEWDNIIIVLPRSERMVDRNMVYTALSRCKQMAVVVYNDHDFIRKQVGLQSAHLKRQSLFLTGANL